jgi:hypothetical protein
MALKAGNIIVGLKAESERTLPNHESAVSFHSIRANLKMQEPAMIPEPVESERYVIRKEGELIVNLNKKSNYLRDALDLD